MMSRGTYGGMGVAVWMLLLGATLLAPKASAQQLQFSNLDQATVRIFSIANIGVREVRGESGAAYQVALPEAGHGSGVLVSSDGLVLTAEHVVHNARRVAVKITGSDEALPATVLHADEEQDFAFLAIDGYFEHVVTFPEVSPPLNVRQRVDAIGYPLDADRDTPQSSQGIVAGNTNDGRLQLSMSVNPGNSGGPLVDEQENLLGVVVARGDPERGVQGIAIAVPIDTIRPTFLGLRGEGSPFAAARARLSSLSAQEKVTAAVLTRLVQVGSVGGVMQEVDKQFTDGTAGRLREELQAALRNGGRSEPDVLTMAAAYIWNAAIWMKEKHRGNPDKALEVVRSLCRDATNRDRELAGRSAFVAMVMSQQTPWGRSPGRLSTYSTAGGESAGGHDSRVARNDTLPSAVISLRAGIAMPYQLLGGGLGVELFASKAHFQLDYMLGWNLETGTGHAYDAYAGYTLARWESESRAKFVLRVRQVAANLALVEYDESDVRVGNAVVMEVGVSGGTIAFARCPRSDCLDSIGYLDDLDTFSQITGQLGLGFRYVRSFAAERADHASASSHLSVFAHALALPFGMPAGEYYFSQLSYAAFKGTPQQPGVMGAQIGGSYSTTFGSGGACLGWLPAIDSFVARITWGYDFRI